MALFTGERSQPRIDLELINPKLQITPLNINDGRIEYTEMEMELLNYSSYIAKNIHVDVKFGDSLWKNELHKASSLDIRSKIGYKVEGKSEDEVKELIYKFLDHPLLGELKPAVKIKIRMYDSNKDWAIKQKMYFGSSDGTSIPIPPEKNPDYLESQGWKEQIENTESGKPIKILFRVEWENEIGKKFDPVFPYQLICTKIGEGRSYTFLPAENVD